MILSNNIVSQFAKLTVNNTKKPVSESIRYGTVVYDGKTYVKLDGSDLLTPVQTTSSVKDGDRVSVMIKDHSATIMGNVTDPSASSSTVEKHDSKISEFEVVMAYKVTTENLEAINATIESLSAAVANVTELEVLNADIRELQAKYANLTYVTAEDMTVINAEIEKLEAKIGEFTDISTEDLEAINAEITNLKGYNAEFTYVSADMLKAFRANIKELEAQKLSAEQADLRYADIDFANIGEAAIKNFYATSGIIKDLVISEGTITGQLVGVTIKGDLIEGGTVVADKLVVLGEDGLYYKLNTNGVTTSAEQTEYNSLSGTIITAKSVTAEKISVNDLVAFDATIGGFNITDKSIYSGVKKSADNTTRGIYLDRDGQVAFGDSNNFVRYFRDSNGQYKLEISADSITLRSSGGKNIEEIVKEAINSVEIGGSNLIRNSDTLIFVDYYFPETEEPTGDYLVDELGNNLLDECDDILIV